MEPPQFITAAHLLNRFEVILLLELPQTYYLDELDVFGYAEEERHPIDMDDVYSKRDLSWANPWRYPLVGVWISCVLFFLLTN